jgi:hypothetical protein
VSANRLRTVLILTLVAAAIISVVGKKADSPLIGWASFALFIVGVFLYFAWRRAVAGRVFDREAKTTDETGPRPDQ